MAAELEFVKCSPCLDLTWVHVSENYVSRKPLLPAAGYKCRRNFHCPLSRVCALRISF